MAKLAFVITRFGRDVVGGAEQHALAMAKLLSANHQVTVFTTTTSEMGNWNEAFPVGESIDEGVRIKRFPISKAVSAKRFHELHQRINRFEPLTSEEYESWVDHSGQSETLFADLKKLEKDFEAIIFFQYLFGLTIRGCELFPQKAILCPTAHEEGPLFAPPVKRMFQTVRQVLWCSEGERMMVQRCLDISPPGVVIGSPVQVTANPSPAALNVGAEPFVLYVGRIESMKNVGLLLSYFERLKFDSDERLKKLKLVLVGSNAMGISSSTNVDVLGKVDRDQLGGLYQKAVTLCVPSLLESFSLVLMEAWLRKTPVLVHGRCDVTREHCLLSGGGLFFTDFYEFRECLLFYLTQPGLARQMALGGEQYVRTHFSPSQVKLNIEYALSFFEKASNAQQERML